MSATDISPVRFRVIWRNERIMAHLDAWWAFDITGQVAAIIREHGVEFEWLPNGCVIARGERPGPALEPPS